MQVSELCNNNLEYRIAMNPDLDLDMGPSNFSGFKLIQYVFASTDNLKLGLDQKT
jgi:hypothetical protein